MPFIGNQPTQGRFIELDSLTASATANYTLQLNSANFSPESVNNLLVSINGIIQGSSTMSLNGAVLTVGAVLSSSDTIDFVRVLGNVGTVSTPTDGSVTANKIGTGAVTSAKIADGTIVNADINASAGIDGSKLGTGAVLQMPFTQYTGTTSVAVNNTSVAIDVLAVNITPKSTSSIIRLDTHIFHEHSLSAGTTDSVWFFYRDTTKLGHAQAGSRQSGISMGTISYDEANANSTPEIASYSYFDAPNTTSQITYKVGFMTYHNATIYINRTVSDADNNGNERGISFISATEIGG